MIFGPKTSSPDVWISDIYGFMSWNIEAYRTETAEMALVVHRLGGRKTSKTSMVQGSVGPQNGYPVEKKHKTYMTCPFALTYLGGGFKYFLFSPLFGEDSHFD